MEEEKRKYLYLLVENIMGSRERNVTFLESPIAGLWLNVNKVLILPLPLQEYKNGTSEVLMVLDLTKSK